MVFWFDSFDSSAMQRGYQELITETLIQQITYPVLKHIVAGSIFGNRKSSFALPKL